MCNQFSLDKSLGPHITLDTQQGHGVWRMTVATLEPLYGKQEQVGDSQISSLSYQAVL